MPFLLPALFGSTLTLVVQQRLSFDERHVAKLNERRRLHSKVVGLIFSLPEAVSRYETSRINFEYKNSIYFVTEKFQAKPSILSSRLNEAQISVATVNERAEDRANLYRDFLETAGLIQTSFEDTERLEMLINDITSYHPTHFAGLNSDIKISEGQKWLRQLNKWKDETSELTIKSAQQEFMPRIQRLADYLKDHIEK